MPVFPSREWCDEAVRLTNADPDCARAGAGWEGDFGLVVEAEPPHLRDAFAVHLEPEAGKIGRWRVLADVDELDEIEPAYLARAPLGVWKGLIRGTLDPVEAVLKRSIVFQGDLQPLLERMRYKGLAERVLSQIVTTFAGEGRG
jgi:putative sterol carrier protein